MRRCLDLAALGLGHVAPNPLVGAVLVCGDRAIGEGYHMHYGEAHAEVNCIRSVKEDDRPLIHKSTLYVSLEPCAHFGKTPPCTNLIIESKIPHVVIGCRDSFAEVNGKGVEQLRAAGIKVTEGILEKECLYGNRRFFTFHREHRPYVILKWAQSADRKIAASAAETSNGRLLISNEYTNRLVHKWRTEESAILVGTKTALSDDPALTARLWPGPHPVRLVIDRELKLPRSLKLFDKSSKTILFNYLKQEEGDPLFYCRLDPGKRILPQVLESLYRMNLQSLIVEGGAALLQSFIGENLWDEARVITNQHLEIGRGVDAPHLPGMEPELRQQVQTDLVEIFHSKSTSSIGSTPG